MDKGEREIRLEIHEVEEILRKTKTIQPNEYLYTIRTEPGEIVIKVVKD
jgi:hypothetical protein